MQILGKGEMHMIGELSHTGEVKKRRAPVHE
jgi:hypothetical protein